MEFYEYWKLVSSQAPLETGYVFRMYGVLIVLCVIVIAIAARRKQIEVDALQITKGDGGSHYDSD